MIALSNDSGQLVSGHTRVCRPNGVSLFGRFAGSSVCPTHAHTQTTERATSVTIGRIGAMNAMRPNNYFCGIVCAIEMYDRRHA